MGSIVPGELANFTILEDNPLPVAAGEIMDIGIWGTVNGGRALPKPVVEGAEADHALLGPIPNGRSLALPAVQWIAGNRTGGSGDISGMKHRVAAAMAVTYSQGERESVRCQ